MNAFLLLTDTPARAGRLAREIAALGPSLIVDLLDPDPSEVLPDPAAVRAVIADVVFRGSTAVAGIKRHLDRVSGRRPPLVCLLHEDTPRARSQVLALGATHLLPADKAPALLAEVFLPLNGGEAAMAPAAAVARADEVLTRILALSREGIVLPEAVSEGAALIEGALRRTELRTWLDVVRRYDDTTHQHCLLVAGLAAGFGIRLGVRPEDLRRLTEAALLHDIGKSLVPHEVLSKPSRLDAAELASMRAHPVLGYEMLRGQGFSGEMLAVARSHHEMLDGSGYPDGLRGAEVPDLVRLVTVCDIFAALVERRPYKAPMAGSEANAILQGMGEKLDQDLVRAFAPVAGSVTP
ncbi:HD-GYP domain-containing protein [Methylorubrum extorquens]